AGSTLVGTVFADPSTNKGAAASDPRQGVAAIQAHPIVNTDPNTWYSERHIGSIDYGLRGSQLLGSALLVTAQASRPQDKYALVAPNLVRTDDLTCSGGTPEAPCAQPAVPNFVTGGYGFVFGAGNDSASHRDQFRADLNLYRGDHEIKAGGDYEDA